MYSNYYKEDILFNRKLKTCLPDTYYIKKNTLYTKQQACTSIRL